MATAAERMRRYRDRLRRGVAIVPIEIEGPDIDLLTGLGLLEDNEDRAAQIGKAVRVLLTYARQGRWPRYAVTNRPGRNSKMDLQQRLKPGPHDA